MSQITVENIKRSTETASRSTRGVAAAWVNFNGTGTVAIRDSMNVASLTDFGTGQYAPNFSNVAATANYSSPVSSGGTVYTIVSDLAYQSNKSAASCRFAHYENGSVVDQESMTMTIHGDLA